MDPNGSVPPPPPPPSGETFIAPHLETPKKKTHPLLVVLFVLFILFDIGIGALIFLNNSKKQATPLLKNQEKSSITAIEDLINNKQQSNSVTSSSTHEWRGVITTTKKGFMEINDKGEVLKENGDAKYFMPPGMSTKYIHDIFAFGNDGENPYKNSMQLLDDGRLTFIGSANGGSATKENTIYSWQMHSSENPQPFFSVDDNKKIVLYEISPDKKAVAIVEITANQQEVNEVLPNNPEYMEKIKKAQAELNVVNIYSLQTKFLIHSFKLIDSLDNKPISASDNSSRITWRGDNLYLFTYKQFWIYNDKSFQQLGESPQYSGVDDTIAISPDGKHFSDQSSMVSFDDKGAVTNIDFDESARIYEHPYSFDSQKMVVAKQETPNPYTGEIEKIGELDLKTGVVTSFGTLQELIPNIQLDTKREEIYFYPQFTVYNPSSDTIIFPIFAWGRPGRFVDLYALKKGEKTAKGNNLKNIEVINSREFNFLGWYKD